MKREGRKISEEGGTHSRRKIRDSNHVPERKAKEDDERRPREAKPVTQGHTATWKEAEPELQLGCSLVEAVQLLLPQASRERPPGTGRAWERP